MALLPSPLRTITLPAHFQIISIFFVCCSALGGWGEREGVSRAWNEDDSLLLLSRSVGYPTAPGHPGCSRPVTVCSFSVCVNSKDSISEYAFKMYNHERISADRILLSRSGRLLVCWCPAAAVKSMITCIILLLRKASGWPNYIVVQSRHQGSYSRWVSLRSQ